MCEERVSFMVLAVSEEEMAGLPGSGSSRTGGERKQLCIADSSS